MSKSEGNFIALNDSSKEMFGRTMALPDEVIIPCFELCTELSLQQIQQIEKELKAEKEFDNIFIEHKVAEINPLKQALKHQTF